MRITLATNKTSITLIKSLNILHHLLPPWLFDVSKSEMTADRRGSLNDRDSISGSNSFDVYVHTSKRRSAGRMDNTKRTLLADSRHELEALLGAWLALA